MKSFLRNSSTLYRWVLQPVLVVAILGLGFLGAMGLASSREAPPRGERNDYAPLVRTQVVTPATVPVVVRGHGTLQARTRVDLVPQVGGRVISIHPALRAGGRFAAEEVLLRIEPRDYELAVARARAEVAASSTNLTTQEAEADAARAEWTALNPQLEVPPLVAREPQIEEAKARVAAAGAALESAELDLERTELRLPFAGRVVTAHVDVGLVVMANQAIGNAYETEVYEVPVPLEPDELGWITLPGDRPGEAGSAARVLVRISGTEVVIPGHAARLAGEIDGVTRMASVIVEVVPNGMTPAIATRLLPGAFVDVEIEGAPLENVVPLPRSALREGGVAWLIEDGHLTFVQPRVRYASGELLYVEGLAPGSVVVTSNLEVASAGMRVRVAEVPQ